VQKKGGCHFSVVVGKGRISSTTVIVETWKVVSITEIGEKKRIASIKEVVEKGRISSITVLVGKGGLSFISAGGKMEDIFVEAGMGRGLVIVEEERGREQD
jgi:hypothetical protein